MTQGIYFSILVFVPLWVGLSDSVVSQLSFLDGARACKTTRKGKCVNCDIMLCIYPRGLRPREVHLYNVGFLRPVMLKKKKKEWNGMK